MWRKIKIAIACWGTVIAIGLIFSSFLSLFGMQDKIKMFIYLHFTIGACLIFIICWPLYSKRMK